MKINDSDNKTGKQIIIMQGHWQYYSVLIWSTCVYMFQDGGFLGVVTIIYNKPNFAHLHKKTEIEICVAAYNGVNDLMVKFSNGGIPSRQWMIGGLWKLKCSL